MTFIALLTKELRVRFRSERTIWVLVVYILFLGIVGILVLNDTTNASYINPASSMSGVGTTLYAVLSIIQFLLIIFIAPAFTATAINGEKERQTYDLLLISHLSGLTLAGGKLFAGLANIFVLIAATVPLFGLVFFFGGVSLLQILETLVILLVTVLLIGTISLLLSTLLRRPAASTALAYVISLSWLGLPILIGFSLLSQPGAIGTMGTIMTNMANIHPLLALLSVEISSSFTNARWLNLPIWLMFSLINTLLALFFFWLTVLFARPRFLRRRRKPAVMGAIIKSV